MTEPETDRHPRRRHRTTARHLWAICGVVLALLPLAGAAAPTQTRLLALDVGEGQSILLARGGHGLLIDTGRPGMGRHVLDRLHHHGIRKLDTVVFTHLHPDHAGAWFRIHEAFPQVRVIDNGHRRPGTSWPDTSRWVALALDRLPEQQRRVVGAGDRWTWRSLRFRTLWPSSTEGGSLNHRSLVLEIRAGDTTILHMGDTGTRVEQTLIERGTLPDDVDILIAGHHGSANTASQPFLEAIAPETVIVSTDADNIRGYPAEETITRLRNHSQRLLRTWKDGEICLQLQSTRASAC